MFDNDVRVESVPKRVYEAVKLVCQNNMTIDELKNKMFHKDIYKGQDDYLRYTLDAAIELKLIKKEEKFLIFVGEKKDVADLNAFRKYCNSIVWKDNQTRFYKIAEVFLNSDIDWLKYKSFSASTEVLGDIRKKTGDFNGSIVQPIHILGERFWLSFLGFGYVFELNNFKVFLPNMYVALKDFISLSELPQNTEISFDEFINGICMTGAVAAKKSLESKKMNYALSAALRQLHDNREVELKRNSDSEVIWNLYPLDSHGFKKEVTHIIIKGGKK